MDHKKIAEYTFSNYFENDYLKEHIAKSFNIKTDRNNLLKIKEDDLKCIFQYLEHLDNESIVEFLLITRFTNIHLIYIEFYYECISNDNIHELLSQSESFKDKLTALITMKTLLK